MSLAATLFAAHPAISGAGKALIGLTAAGVAITLNFLRLAVTLWLYDSGRTRLAHGGPHALLGQLVLGVGVALLFVIFRLLLRGRGSR
jgi:exosortase/archaeosortase family protein